MNSPLNLLDQALALNYTTTAITFSSSFKSPVVILVEDCVETSGAFVLHHLIKRSLSPQTAGVVVFLALSHPFSHYDRIMRKMGYNLSVHRENKRVHFIDVLNLDCPSDQKDGLVGLFLEVQRAVEVMASGDNRRGCVTLMIDDVSMLEIAAHGDENRVLDFLHYCVTLTSELGCSLVFLNHEDLYEGEEGSRLLSSLEYLADILIKTAPLSTGLASDVHGQLTVIRKALVNEAGYSANKVSNFQFKVKENSVEYFYPGSQH